MRLIWNGRVKFCHVEWPKRAAGRTLWIDLAMLKTGKEPWLILCARFSRPRWKKPIPASRGSYVPLELARAEPS